MDVNLTGQIAATLAENLKQPGYIPLINIGAGVIGGLVTGIITLFGVIMTIRYYKRKDDQKHEDEKRIERKNAYSQLSSQKKLSQLYMSRYVAQVYSQYYSTANNQENHIYWVQKGNEYLDRLYLEEKRLFEIIGLISVIFPKTENLTTLINRIYEMQPPELTPNSTTPKDPKELDIWRKHTIEELSVVIKEKYLQPIDDLLNFLNKYLERDLLEETSKKP
jgi:hypothetical protein